MSRDSVPTHPSARPRTAMRMVARLAVMLAAGMLASLLAALGCTAFQDGDLTWTSEADASGTPVLRSWLWPIPANWSKKPSAYSWNRSFGYGADTVSWSPARPGQQWFAVTQSQTRYRSGFPFPAFESRFQGLTGEVSRFELGRFAWFSWERGGMWTLASPTAMPEVVVPLMPYWPGLIADALLFGVVGGSLVLYLAGTRRRRRLRRGLCLRCGYTLAGLTQCPECGAPARSAAA